MVSESRDVVVTDVKMPFMSMVILMVKWALASIPAVIILFVIFLILGAIFPRSVVALLSDYKVAAFCNLR